MGTMLRMLDSGQTTRWTMSGIHYSRLYHWLMFIKKPDEGEMLCLISKLGCVPHTIGMYIVYLPTWVYAYLLSNLYCMY